MKATITPLPGSTGPRAILTVTGPHGPHTPTAEYPLVEQHCVRDAHLWGSEATRVLDAHGHLRHEQRPRWNPPRQDGSRTATI